MLPVAKTRHLYCLPSFPTALAVASPKQYMHRPPPPALTVASSRRYLCCTACPSSSFSPSSWSLAAATAASSSPSCAVISPRRSPSSRSLASVTAASRSVSRTLRESSVTALSCCVRVTALGSPPRALERACVCGTVLVFRLLGLANHPNPRV